MAIVLLYALFTPTKFAIFYQLKSRLAITVPYFCPYFENLPDEAIHIDSSINGVIIFYCL